MFNGLYKEAKLIRALVGEVPGPMIPAGSVSCSEPDVLTFEDDRSDVLVHEAVRAGDSSPLPRSPIRDEYALIGCHPDLVPVSEYVYRATAAGFG